MRIRDWSSDVCSSDLFAALAMIATPKVFMFMILGIPIGLFFGILPGLGGIASLAILIPFAYGMDPVAGLAFLLSAHVLVATGGSVTSDRTSVVEGKGVAVRVDPGGRPIHIKKN